MGISALSCPQNIDQYFASPSHQVAVALLNYTFFQAGTFGISLLLATMAGNDEKMDDARNEEKVIGMTQSTTLARMENIDVEAANNDNDLLPPLLPLSPGSNHKDISQCTLCYYSIKAKCAIIYMHVDVSSYNNLSRIIYTFFVIVVALCVMNNIISSLPSLQEFPTTCDKPACQNDPDLCPQRTICAPVTHAFFNMIDNVCIWIFTVEYVLRVGTCWSVSPIVLGLVDINVVTIPHYGPLEQTVRFVLRFQNLIDLAAITPYYVGLFVDLVDEASFIVRTLRLLRLARVLRLLRVVKAFEKFNVAASLLQEAVRKAWPVVGLFLFYGILALVLMGCIMYICERGTYTVSKEYPDGVWLRKAIDGYHTEVSPFDSIPTTFYWVIVTTCTVGYGDLVPTSVAGRALGSLCCVLGVIGIAIPVAVLGTEFTRAYNNYYNMALQLEEKRKERMTTALSKSCRQKTSPMKKKGTAALKKF